MPVIKIFTAHPTPAPAAEALAQDLEHLCLTLMRAQPTTIQVLLVQALMARGNAVLVEAHYRAQPYRDAEALERFMDGVDRSVQQHLGEQPRIRCFAVDQVDLSARH